ncbi:MAG TPA: HAD family hydrolase [Candidatus Saccharimonadales bacterium]|nr:HAD family hydrolase [Candidatus Saccharimonadales bacterium]
MIKAIVLDIDGVIVGDQEGNNFPHPNEKIRSVLRKIHDDGIPVSFLTAKPAFAAAENIKYVGIDNPHIADGGATIFNPLKNQIIHRTPVAEKDILPLLASLPKQTYVSLFGINEYYMKSDMNQEFTTRYAKIFERLPIITDDIEAVIKKESIMKVNIVAFDDQQKESITNIITNLKGPYSFKWATHPFIKPIHVMVVTAKGISKRSGVEYLAKYLNVPFSEILAVGDTIQDWDFMEICGYKAAMGNASADLKEKIDIHDANQMIGGDVNKDGLLDIFKHFNLI